MKIRSKKERNMAKKAAAPEKKTSKRKVNKGDSLVCEVCGLSVMIEDVGGVVVAEESALLCCGKPMKQKTGKVKVTKK
jgi:hypothetical protein